jgi:hypothetical protein
MANGKGSWCERHYMKMSEQYGIHHTCENERRNKLPQSVDCQLFEKQRNGYIDRCKEQEGPFKKIWTQANEKNEANYSVNTLRQ